MTSAADALRSLAPASPAPADPIAAPPAAAPEKRPPGRPKGSKTMNRAAPAAKPAADAPTAADEEKTRAEAERAERVRQLFSGPQRAEFAKALGDLYALPFEAAATFSDVESMRLGEKTKQARGELCLLVVEAYGGNWIRHLPAIMLGAAFVADSGVCLAAYRDARKSRKAAGGPAPSTPPLVARGVPVASSAAPVNGAPPVFATPATPADGEKAKQLGVQ